MPQYKLHCFGESGNAYKAALMLELTGQDWQPVLVDYFHGQTGMAPDDLEIHPVTGLRFAD